MKRKIYTRRNTGGFESEVQCFQNNISCYFKIKVSVTENLLCLFVGSTSFVHFRHLISCFLQQFLPLFLLTLFHPFSLPFLFIYLYFFYSTIFLFLSLFFVSPFLSFLGNKLSRRLTWFKCVLNFVPIF
jgi:hypothetical protein